MLLVLVACGRDSRPPAQTLEQRFHEIEALGTTPDDWMALLAIVAGDHHWNGRLDDASELATRCRGLKVLAANAGRLPPKYLGSVYRRCSERPDDLVSAKLVLRLLDDPNTCDGMTAFAGTISAFLDACAFPSLRKELERRHLDRAVANVDRLAGWHPTEAANRIEQAAADGDIAAFQRTIVALSKTSDADRAAVTDTGVAVFAWLVRLVYQPMEMSCCGPLETAIADGDLGEELVNRLAVEPDREIRRMMWWVFATQPRPKSAARLREIADKELDPDVKFEANDALGWAKVGGQRVHDNLENTKHELHRDAGP